MGRVSVKKPGEIWSRKEKGETRLIQAQFSGDTQISKWPKNLHAICPNLVVNGGYSEECSDYLTTFAMVLGGRENAKYLPCLAEGSDTPI